MSDFQSKKRGSFMPASSVLSLSSKRIAASPEDEPRPDAETGDDTLANVDVDALVSEFNSYRPRPLPVSITALVPATPQAAQVHIGLPDNLTKLGRIFDYLCDKRVISRPPADDDAQSKPILWSDIRDRVTRFTGCELVKYSALMNHTVAVFESGDSAAPSHGAGFGLSNACFPKNRKVTYIDGRGKRIISPAMAVEYHSVFTNFAKAPIDLVWNLSFAGGAVEPDSANSECKSGNPGIKYDDRFVKFVEVLEGIVKSTIRGIVVSYLTGQIPADILSQIIGDATPTANQGLVRAILEQAKNEVGDISQVDQEVAELTTEIKIATRKGDMAGVAAATASRDAAVTKSLGKRQSVVECAVGRLFAECTDGPMRKSSTGSRQLRFEAKAFWNRPMHAPQDVASITSLRATRDSDSTSWTGIDERVRTTVADMEASDCSLCAVAIPQPMRHISVKDETFIVSQAPVENRSNIGAGSVGSVVFSVRIVTTSGMGRPFQVYLVMHEFICMRQRAESRSGMNIPDASSAVDEATFNSFV